MSGTISEADVKWDAPPAIDPAQVRWDDAPVDAAEADAIKMPARFQSRIAKPQVQIPALPSTDEVRAALAPRPDTQYGELVPLARRTDTQGDPTGAPFVTLPGIVRNTLLGALDIGQGRYQTDDTGRMVPTQNSLMALSLGAGVSPAYRSGQAIAETAAHGAPLAALAARGRAPPSVAAPLAEAPVARLVEASPAEAPRIAEPVAAQPGVTAAPQVQTDGPRSVGAAGTPTKAANMSPAETLAERTRAEADALFAPPVSRDATEYVPGVKPTQAELELNPSVSRAGKMLRMEKPEPFIARDRQIADAYASYYDDMAGTDTLVLRAKEARDLAATRALEGAWAAKTDADTAPVREAIEKIMSGPEGRRSVVERELETISGKLTGRDGKVITDPEMLYGVRKHINDRLSREVGTTDQEVKLARAVLMDVRQELDQAIEAAAPGFRDYLATYAEMSRPIDVMEELIGARAKLFKGADRHVAFHDFDRVMKDWASDRAAAGVNPAKSITDDEWQKLMGMWKSLQRSAEAERLSRTAGSDTAQNLFDMARKGTAAGLHLAGVATLNPLVNVATSLASQQMGKRRVESQLKEFFAPTSK